MEFIICSAVYYDDGKKRDYQPINIKTGIVVCGLRHCNCFVILATLFPNFEYKKNEISGFVTSLGRFVAREEAAIVASQANQVTEFHARQHGLFSEDIFIQNNEERIACAAHYYDDGKKYAHSPRNIESGIVVYGQRHCNCIIIMAELFPNLNYRKTHEFGFLTTHNRFANRQEAAQIAFQTKQIVKQKEELYSEDLY